MTMIRRATGMRLPRSELWLAPCENAHVDTEPAKKTVISIGVIRQLQLYFARLILMSPPLASPVLPADTLGQLVSCQAQVHRRDRRVAPCYTQTGQDEGS